jgi:hypothetical protein
MGAAKLAALFFGGVRTQTTSGERRPLIIRDSAGFQPSD